MPTCRDGPELANLFVSLGHTLSNLVLPGIYVDGVRHLTFTLSYFYYARPVTLYLPPDLPIEAELVSPSTPQRNFDFALSYLNSLEHLHISWLMTGPKLLDAISQAPLEVCILVGKPVMTSGTDFANRLVDGVSFARLEKLYFHGLPREGSWSAFERRSLRNACFKSVCLSGLNISTANTLLYSRSIALSIWIPTFGPP
jgi:hypothetical protein